MVPPNVIEGITETSDGNHLVNWTKVPFLRDPDTQLSQAAISSGSHARLLEDNSDTEEFSHQQENSHVLARLPTELAEKIPTHVVIHLIRCSSGLFPGTLGFWTI